MKRRPICVRIPEDLLLQVDSFLLDARGRVKHGAKQALIERLLREWVAKQLEKEKEES